MPARIARNILLVGLMGTGKSSLARYLSRKTGCPVLDTDAEIERAAGEPISGLFAKRGEEYFRDAETKLLRDYFDRAGFIVSTGGGMVIRQENREMLGEMGLVVWLQASEEVIFGRVSRNSKRPLLQTEDPRGTLHALSVSREPWYREVAQLEIDTGRLSRHEAARGVLETAGWICKPR